MIGWLKNLFKRKDTLTDEQFESISKRSEFIQMQLLGANLPLPKGWTIKGVIHDDSGVPVNADTISYSPRSPDRRLEKQMWIDQITLEMVEAQRSPVLSAEPGHVEVPRTPKPRKKLKGSGGTQ